MTTEAVDLDKQVPCYLMIVKFSIEKPTAKPGVYLPGLASLGFGNVAGDVRERLLLPEAADATKQQNRTLQRAMEEVPSKLKTWKFDGN